MNNYKDILDMKLGSIMQDNKSLEVLNMYLKIIGLEIINHNSDNPIKLPYIENYVKDLIRYRIEELAEFVEIELPENILDSYTNMSTNNFMNIKLGNFTDAIKDAIDDGIDEYIIIPDCINDSI